MSRNGNSRVGRKGSDPGKDEGLYRKLVENSLTGIYIVQDDCIVFANPCFAEIFGYGQAEVLGLEIERLVHPDDRDLIDRMRIKRLRGEDVQAEYEARGLTREGKTIWVRRRNTDIRFHGRSAVLGNIVDITRQKRAEETLKQSNEELKIFLHSIAHDLRSHVIAVQGFASRLMKRDGGRLSDKGRNYLERIARSAERLDAFTRDVGVLSRLGRMVPKMERVSTGAVVREVLENLRAEGKAGAAEIRIAEDMPAVQTDRERLYQVFQNLIENALQYAKKGELPRIEVGYAAEERYHRFYVKDNGIGIDPGERERIFKKFSRLKETAVEGTGLGLAIVKQIIDNLGGEIRVESEKGRGATFHFRLPGETGDPSDD